jgi:hypothetical protein
MSRDCHWIRQLPCVIVLEVGAIVCLLSPFFSTLIRMGPLRQIVLFGQSQDILSLLGAVIIIGAAVFVALGKPSADGTAADSLETSALNEIEDQS